MNSEFIKYYNSNHILHNMVKAGNSPNEIIIALCQQIDRMKNEIVRLKKFEPIETEWKREYMCQFWEPKEQQGRSKNE
jgi:hypothetical protein